MQPQLTAWTRDALERLFDLAFLQHHARATGVAGRFTDGRMLQQALLAAIKQLKPPLNVPSGAPAWRIYNVLNLRYVQGLSQTESAMQLSIGSRQMRREQQRAIRAIATLLFEDLEAPNLATDLATVPADADMDTAHIAQPAPFVQPARMVRPATADHARVPELTYLDDLLRSTLSLFNSLLDQQGLHVTVAAPASMPAVRANRMLLRQLLVSAVNWLIHDARDVSLSIEARIERGAIAISLSKPWPASGRTLDYGDAALATVQQMAQLLGVHVEQTGDTAAIRLAFHLPTDQAQCVLMIDDNPHAVRLVQRYLQQSGEFYLVALTDPREALKQVVELRPACVLLDVMMPERDGWELLTLFRAHPEVASIPIIVSSVLKEHELARALGAAAVLTKPYTAPELLELLRAVLRPPD